MKKQYIKPETVFVDLITEGDFCCSKCNDPSCLGDCDDEGEGIDDDNTDPPTKVDICAYRRPIWED